MSSTDGASSSTLKSYVDSATGAVQSALGSVTGSNVDKAQGETTKDQAQAEHEASHTTAKVGSFTADPNTGAAVQDHENRTTGKWDQTVGSAKEFAGNVIGSENLRQTGAKQNESGKAQEAKGQLQDLGQGYSDRAQGALGSIGAAITGDRAKEEEYRQIHDEGKARQRGAEADIQAKGGQ
ncbi:hypothetical protein Plec18170_007138 [Paecilomyces lecythidis]